MIGDKYERWTVIGEAHRIKNKTYCLCRCDCEQERLVRLDQLRRGISKSCGCIAKDRKYSDEKKRLIKSEYRKTERARALNKAGVLRYRETENGKATYKKAIKKYRANNPEIRSAHIATSNAIASGVLLKLPCEVCGDPNVQAHHEDYREKLSVRWLCVKHHFEHHAVSKAAGVKQ